jgi:hypothetical protein
VHIAANTISFIFAFVILISSIVGLHYVSSETTRLIIICVFTLVFAGGVKLSTTASRSEVFGASAALVLSFSLHPASG